MKNQYSIKVDLMKSNYETLKKSFKWEADLSKHLIALNYAMKDKAVEVEKIKGLKDFIKQETGAFSHFRGTSMYPISGLLSSQYNDPNAEFSKMLNMEKTMKQAGFKQSTYLTTALYALNVAYQGNDPEGFLLQSQDTYKEMKRNHPFLTSGDDYALAILLTASRQNLDLLEQYYVGLNGVGFTKSNGLQMLSQILSLQQNNVEATINKCKRMYEALKQEKLKVTTEYYSALGLLCMIDRDENELTQEMIMVAKGLKNEKKYKWLNKGMHLLMASAIISSDYVKVTEQEAMTTALQVTIQAILIAQQTAMIAAVGAGAAAGAAT